MTQLPVGLIVLLAVAALVYFGVAQRVLDRMGLTDKVALLFIGAMLVGTYLPDIPLWDNVAINIGGGIVPLVLVGYIIAKAEPHEKLRAILAGVVTGAVIFGTMRIMPLEPTYAFLLDPTIAFGVLAGIIGYIAGRSRRSAFIAGILGIVLADIIARIDIFIRGVMGETVIGGAGIFDAVVLAGVLAVGLAEFFGEARERLHGGSDREGNTIKEPEELNSEQLAHQELSEELDAEEVKDDE